LDQSTRILLGGIQQDRDPQAGEMLAALRREA
jgi:hypothetical protein